MRFNYVRNKFFVLNFIFPDDGVVSVIIAVNNHRF